MVSVYKNGLWASIRYNLSSAAVAAHLLSGHALPPFPYSHANPIVTPPRTDLSPRSIAIDYPITPPASHLTNRELSKRATTAFLPGGFNCHFGAELQAFDHIRNAAQYLEAFYKWAWDDLNSGQYDNVQTRTLSIKDETFELLFRERDSSRAISMIMVRQFVALMLRRTERGWVVKYAGTVEGPGGIAVDMILQTVGGVAINILDSAMDMYGN
ncbi:MAG: hypothetical protein Q9220_007306 [cf. Caloplaca sp. 1 TL-2023]